MRKGFTLIELLIVITIIAILAAILFPIFRRALEASRRATCTSNLYQISRAIIMYAGDSDDKFPRNDGCLPGVSLNPALKVGNVQGDGCSNWPFAFRQNHYKWPIWVFGYAGKSVDLFTCPSRERDPRNWNENGELMNAYALNLSLTGALNTFTDPAGPGAIRNSFLGGAITDVPQPSSTMLLMELSSSRISFMPVFTTPSANIQTAYPAALRELWEPFMFEWVSPSNCNTTGQVDRQHIPHNDGFIVSRVDGSAKFLSVRAFLARCPTRDDYVVPAYAGGWQCGPIDGSRTVATPPVWYEEWPLWALH